MPEPRRPSDHDPAGAVRETGDAHRPGRVGIGPPSTTGALVGRAREIAAVVALAALVTLGCLTAWAIAPTAAGWQPVVVTSGSMEPAVRAGDVVLVDPDARLVRRGQVVLVRRGGPDGQDLLHRVVAVAPDGTVTTRGDANRSIDPERVGRERLSGTARLVIPAAGRIAMLWRRGDAEDVRWAALVGVAVLLVVTRPAPPDRVTDDEAPDPQHPGRGVPGEV